MDNERNGRRVSSAAASRRAYEAVLEAFQSGQLRPSMHTMRALAILQQSAQDLERIEVEQEMLGNPAAWSREEGRSGGL